MLPLRQDDDEVIQELSGNPGDHLLGRLPEEPFEPMEDEDESPLVG